MLAVTNFTTMLLHVGGQDDSYNREFFVVTIVTNINIPPAFTPPPTNLSTTKQWTTG